MIRIMKAKGNCPRGDLCRSNPQVDVSAVVREILETVRAQGDKALYDYCEKFDHVTLPSLEVSQAEKDEAMQAVDPAFLEILRMAAENIRAFHRQQVRTSFILTGPPRRGHGAENHAY